VKGQVCAAEEAEQFGHSLYGALHGRLHEHVQLALEGGDRMRMVDGHSSVAGDEATGRLIHGIERQHDGCFRAQRMASREPTPDPCGCAAEAKVLGPRVDSYDPQWHPSDHAATSLRSGSGSAGKASASRRSAARRNVGSSNR
jgi:hypothetical protein